MKNTIKDFDLDLKTTKNNSDRVYEEFEGSSIGAR